MYMHLTKVKFQVNIIYMVKDFPTHIVVVADALKIFFKNIQEDIFKKKDEIHFICRHKTGLRNSL